MTNYWVVGASFNNGSIDKYDEFILRSYWYLGWTEEDSENRNVNTYINRAKQMKCGDRIAIKQLLGQGQSEIMIRAIGIIKDVDIKDENIIAYVKWLVKDIDRNVPIKGCVGSVYGPFKFNDGWTRQVFCI
jgi:hypothetical protein